jgi:PAS domain S-box-containing protein
MRKSFELLQEIVDSLPFAALAVTSSGTVAWWNRTSERVFGWKRSQVLGQPNPIVPADREGEYDAFREIASSGKVLRVKSARQTKSGTLVQVNSTIIPMHVGSDAANHILILHEPIGECASEPRKDAIPSARNSSLKDGDCDRLSDALHRFTPRQREVIILAQRGGTNREISKSLSLGEQQVKNYLRGIYREINVKGRTGLATWLNRQWERNE